MKDLRYLTTKTLVLSVYAAEGDLDRVGEQFPTDTALHWLKRSFANMTHLLNLTKSFDDIAAVVYSRLRHIDILSAECQAFQQELPRPFLMPWHRLPDLPPPGLVRTLRNHTSEITSCAISPTGDWLLSGSADRTLKIWDAASGQLLHTLTGHTSFVTACAISPDGSWLLSASADCTFRVWDAASGQLLHTLTDHTGSVTACAISPDGAWLLCGSTDHTLKIWEAVSGTPLPPSLVILAS